MKWFDHAKMWSDFLGFHIRAVVFFTFGHISFSMASNADLESTFSYIDAILRLGSALFFFLYGLVMLALITTILMEFFFFDTKGFFTRTSSLILMIVFLLAGLFASFSTSSTIVEFARRQAGAEF